ncbi:MAG: hypothetical protein QOH81_454 [Sphingomonadales bacterium]|nr:hypothetical protein [Sphingomonadales bacterium]
MDVPTHLALQAIIRGLLDSGAITAEHVHGIAAALHRAEMTRRERHCSVDAYELMQLARDISSDAGMADPG